MDTTVVILLLLAAMHIKHLLGDFYFHTMWMMDGRETYFHLGRATHAGIHAVLTGIVFALFGTPLWLLLLLAAAEWVLHFHIDWWKASQTKAKCWTPADASFWRALGTDQAMHHLCNLFLVWIWLIYA